MHSQHSVAKINNKLRHDGAGPQFNSHHPRGSHRPNTTLWPDPWSKYKNGGEHSLSHPVHNDGEVWGQISRQNPSLAIIGAHTYPALRLNANKQVKGHADNSNNAPTIDLKGPTGTASDFMAAYPALEAYSPHTEIHDYDINKTVAVTAALGAPGKSADYIGNLPMGGTPDGNAVEDNAIASYEAAGLSHNVNMKAGRTMNYSQRLYAHESLGNGPMLANAKQSFIQSNDIKSAQF